MSRFAVVAHGLSSTNVRLGMVLTPSQAVVRLGRGDVALGRIDVMASLDGVERGLWTLDLLERRGVTVLNRRRSLAAAHDKLATAAALAKASVLHPRTVHVAPWLPLPAFDAPVVLKPRFGSWGRDVVRCETRAEVLRALGLARTRVWFNATGGVLQQLVAPAGYDLRVVVAGGRVAGAIHRIAAHGEWRTNVALGGRRSPAVPDRAACALALAAAAALGADLVGVDLLPLPDGGWTVIEVNGAVEFSSEYSLDGHEVFAAVRAGLLPGEGGWRPLGLLPCSSPRSFAEHGRTRGSSASASARPMLGLRLATWVTSTRWVRRRAGRGRGCAPARAGTRAGGSASGPARASRCRAGRRAAPRSSPGGRGASR